MKRIAVFCATFFLIGGAVGAAPLLQQQSGGVQTFPYIPRFCEWRTSTGQYVEPGALYVVPGIVTPTCNCGVESTMLYIPGTIYYRPPEVRNTTHHQFVCVPITELPQPRKEKQ